MAYTYTIRTNHHEYRLWSFHDLPKKWQKWFDYIDEDEKHSARFFKYLRTWYDLQEFMRLGVRNFNDDQFKRWDGYKGDSFFSGILIKFPKENYDYDTVIVGRYYC